MTFSYVRNSLIFDQKYIKPYLTRLQKILRIPILFYKNFINFLYYLTKAILGENYIKEIWLAIISAKRFPYN